jgi:allantoin racemase
VAEILWVNPVGSGAFDHETVDLIDAIRSPQHTPRVRHLEQGPPHLEYHLYEHEAFSGMLAHMQEAEADGCGAGIIGCFYDGGLRELRESLRMPVVGMAEAAMLYALTLGYRFSIIVGRRKWIPKMTDNVILGGYERRLASLRAVEMGIPEVAADPELFFDRVIAESRRAVEEDGAEVVVLSEIATPAFWERAAAEVEFPIVDPGVACWKWAEMVSDIYLRTGQSHSKIGGFESPPAVRDALPSGG